MKKIIVIDSYNSDKIAEFLQKIYKNKAIVSYCPNPENDADPIPIEEIEGKYDLFFVSGQMIFYKQISLIALLEKHGEKEAKVVVMSTSHYYLEGVKNRAFVDFLLDKSPILDSLGGDVTDGLKERLESYL